MAKAIFYANGVLGCGKTGEYRMLSLWGDNVHKSSERWKPNELQSTRLLAGPQHLDFSLIFGFLVTKLVSIISQWHWETWYFWNWFFKISNKIWIFHPIFSIISIRNNLKKEIVTVGENHGDVCDIRLDTFISSTIDVS